MSVVGSFPHFSCVSVAESEAASLEIKVGEKLTPYEKKEVEILLARRRKCFPAVDGSISHTTEANHIIDTGVTSPIRTVPYRVSAFERCVITHKVERC